MSSRYVSTKEEVVVERMTWKVKMTEVAFDPCPPFLSASLFISCLTFSQIKNIKEGRKELAVSEKMRGRMMVFE